MELFWFLPTHGDGRYLGTTIGARSVDLPYLTQIARAADDLGYAGVLLGPAALGFVAKASSLPIAFGLLVVLLLGVASVARLATRG